MNSRRPPAPESLDATVAGHRVHYRKCGSGPPMLLIHGLLGYGFSWRFNMQQLAESATVYAPDLLGMGHSDRVSNLDASLTATADRLFAFLDSAGVDQVDVLGTSHGGAVAMWMAAARPDRVRRLILVAPVNPYCSNVEPLVRFWQSPLGKWFGARVPFLPRAVQEICLARMYGDASRVADGTLDGYVEPLKVPGTTDHVLNVLARWHEDLAALRQKLRELPAIPTLLIWGGHDRAVGLKSCAMLRKHMPFSRLVVLDGAGHLPYEEQPQEFNSAVMEFLAKTAAAPNVLNWQQSSAA